MKCQKCMRYLRWIQTQTYFLSSSLSIISLVTQFLVLVLSDARMSLAFADVDSEKSYLISMRTGWTSSSELPQQPYINLLSYQATYQYSAVQPFVPLRSRSAWIPWQINDSRLLLREREEFIIANGLFSVSIFLPPPNMWLCLWGTQKYLP